MRLLPCTHEPQYNTVVGSHSFIYDQLIMSHIWSFMVQNDPTFPQN